MVVAHSKKPNDKGCICWFRFAPQQYTLYCSATGGAGDELPAGLLTMPPRRGTRDPGWAAVEDELGLWLPGSYEALVERFGVVPVHPKSENTGPGCRFAGQPFDYP
jgi:hypothetical protein